jgi:hypothetical protein
MSTSNYEFRVFVIGDFQVGKSSIVKRFKKLNSTQTEDDNYFIPGNPKAEFGLDKINTKEDQEKFDKYQQLDVIQKGFVRKQIERKNLMKFKKIFIVGKTRLEFNFFPLKSAEEKIMTGLNDARDEDEEVKFGNQLINFKSIQEEIRNYLIKEKKDESSDINNLFLFVYDLKNFSTFKKLELYYNKLNDYFKIDNNYIKALLGNKVDSKIVVPKKDKDYLETFLKNNPELKYYEISTYNYFNFENFFEMLFKDIISPSYEELQKPTFLNRFHLVLHSRPTLSRAERKIHKINDVPFLAEGENPDVYAYPEDRAEFRRTFSNMKKGRYGFKIFINKQGPIFPAIDKTSQDKNKHGGFLSKPGTAFGRDKKAKTAIGFGNWEINNRNKEIREALQTNMPGYSLGIRGGKFDFRKERKDKFKEREEELKSAFQEHYARSLLDRKEVSNNKKDFDYRGRKKEILKQIVEKIQDNENRHLQDRKKNIQDKENLLKEKIDKIKSKQDKYQRIYEKNQQQIMQKRQEMSHPKTAISRKSKLSKDLPNYTLYDITTKHDPNKGWTMGMKYTYNPNKNKDDPDFPNLKSEFEKIVNHPKYAEIKYTAPRFKEEKIVKPSNDEKYYDDTEERLKIKNNREKSERNMKIKKFLMDQKKNAKKVQENKKNLQEAREMELEELKEQIIKPRNGEYDSGANLDYVDINYKLVEEASPNYTMKGRYNHGSIFDMPDNYSLINNEDDEDENKIGSNGKPIQDEEYKKSLPVPQYNAVRPSLPTYSFSKATRFHSKPLYQPSPNAVPVMPFQDGKFKPDEVKSFFQGKEGLYKAKKDNELKNNGIPGPGQYRIKGFAEILAEKGKKISDVKDGIKRKEKEMEMRKREEEKNLENLNKIGGGENTEMTGTQKKNLKNMEMKLGDFNDSDNDNSNVHANNNNAQENNNENQ